MRLRSGWFSDRSACYLAAGRPVVTQDTRFGKVLPTGQGLFAFNTMEEILAAFETIIPITKSTAKPHAPLPKNILEPKRCWQDSLKMQECDYGR